MASFVGRASELSRLRTSLAEVAATGDGQMIALRGRRQVGKSTLVEQFCTTAGVPWLFFVAARRQPPAGALADFAAELATSSLPGAAAAAEGSLASWPQALDVATAGATGPVIVVLDEFPWLVEGDESIEGLMQRSWDRTLRKRSVLVVLIGSDLAMMDALTAHGRPLYDRVSLLPIEPLDPADVAELADLSPADAIDAWSITGGYPNLVRAWQVGAPVSEYLRNQLADATSPLIVAGERKLTAEFPPDAFARPVLDAIGTGSREHGKIASKAAMSASSLDRALTMLTAKSAITKERPYSTQPSRLAHYRVSDAHLRFWLHFVAPNLPAIERGAAEVVIRRVLADWPTWRGEAVEPIIAASVARLAPRLADLDRTGHVGRWWRRDGQVEADLVLGDRSPTAQDLFAVGSVKWRENAPFDVRDLAALARAGVEVPGAADLPLVAVSRTGFTSTDLLLHSWGPDDLLSAWR